MTAKRLHYTTLKEIRRYAPCAQGWEILTEALGVGFPTTAPITFGCILATNGLADTLWALRADLHPEARQTEALLCADIAETVLPIFERNRPGDDRPRKCIDARRAWARAPTKKNRKALADALAAAEADALAAAEAAGDTAASYAAYAAAGDAAGDAARDTAYAAAGSYTLAAARDEITALLHKHYQPQTLPSSPPPSAPPPTLP